MRATGRCGAANPGAPPPLGRLVAEFGLRSYQTLREWAQWALGSIGGTNQET